MFKVVFRKLIVDLSVPPDIFCIDSQRPWMYGLRKFHKSDIPLQPILSMCHSIQHSLAKWLIQVLNPVLAFYSGFGADDLFTFSSMIRQFLPCVDSQFIVSFDIISLLTNVPLDEVISICGNFLYRSPLTSVHSFPESVFVELMELATKSVSFSFNDTIYRQVDGISMGSPLGPILENIFVRYSEKLLFDIFPILIFIYVTWIILSLVFVHVMNLCRSSSGGIIYIYIYIYISSKELETAQIIFFKSQF